MTVKIGILGVGGRMGQALVQAIDEQDDAILQGGSECPGHALIGAPLGDGAHIYDDPHALAENCDVLIDFTAPAALGAHLECARQHGCALVVGTTGLGPHNHAAIDDAAKNIAVLQADNMSLGVNMLAHLVQHAAQALGDDWDIEILEMHHRHKVDAPSGTALMLGRMAAAGRGVNLDDVSDKVRDGITGARKTGDIGFATLRGGSVAGDHDVIFASDKERLILSHRAEDRMIFAMGAVKAALWLTNQKSGRYQIADMLNLNLGK